MVKGDNTEVAGRLTSLNGVGLIKILHGNLKKALRNVMFALNILTTETEKLV